MEMLSPQFLLALGLAGIAAVVWLVRLEGKIFNLYDKFKSVKDANEATQKDVDAVRTRQEMIDSQLSAELKSIQVELAQIKGFLMHAGKAKYTPKS
jgi:DNA polymerase III delta prime subunit